MAIETRYGHCACGCGEQTTISPYNNARYGYIKGEPRRYRQGHSRGRGKIVDYLAECLEDLGWITPCQIWQRGTTSRYASVGRSGGRSGLVHRVVYEERHGPIPKGLDIDHLCNVTLCINVDHLEAITHQENIRRHNERERQEWDDLIIELRRVGDKQSLRLVNRVERRRELTFARTRMWHRYNGASAT